MRKAHGLLSVGFARVRTFVDNPNPVAPSADWHPDADLVPLAVAPPEPAAKSADQPLSAGQTVRRLAHVGVAFVSLFLIVRSFALEPFGVPTGSMAETLLGNHREGTCPRCGYAVRVGQPSRDRAARFDDARCPNCAAAVDLSKAPEIPGDRVLVDKNVYAVRRPRRWEVAVFRCPVDLSKPYVKRVVGLPGEAIQVIDGDAYANGVLLRKTLAEVRETKVPFFDMRYPPEPDGWAARWLVEPVVGDAKVPAIHKDATPAGPDVLRDGVLTLNGTDGAGVGLTYHHWQFDAKDDDPVRDALTYNDAAPVPRRALAVHDFVLECDVEVMSGSGSFACRLGDGANYATADFPVAGGPKECIGIGTDSVSSAVFDGPRPVLGSLDRLRPGRTYHVEFAFVDRRVSLAIDGAEVVAPLVLPSKFDRGGVRRPLQLGARGAVVRVKNLTLSHDIHYRADGPNANKTPCQLGPDEYFMLGDNSPDSHDSRGWAIPGVPERDFVGKPFLIHQPMRLGRVTVNGRERVFQSVDWDRLRWLR